MPLRRFVDPDSDRPLRVLAVGAHADDIEIGCGGTLLRMADEDEPYELGWVVLSARNERRAEAERARDLFAPKGCVYSALHDYRDSFFPTVFAELKELFYEIRTRFDADVVLTHSLHDRHQDHRLVAELAWNTWRDHPIFEFEIPKWEGDLQTPNIYVRLDEDRLERKVSYIREAFVSQRDKPWFNEAAFRAMAHLRGVECNAGAAEGFHARKLVVR